MKITMLSSLPPIKGISKYTVSLLGGMPENQEIEVLNFKQMYPEKLYPGGTRDNSLREIDMPNVKVRTFLTWYNPLGWVYAGLTAKGDIIHAQWWTYVLAPVYLFVLGAAKLRGKKIIITVHNVRPHERGLIKDIANNTTYRLANHFIVHNEANKQVFMQEHDDIPSSKISVVPFGVLLPDTPTTGMGQAAARKRLKLSASAKVILFFGIIREYKGLDILIEALADVREKIPNAQLVIAGKAWESWDKYEKLIKKYGLESAVQTHLEFIPEQDIEVYFAAADVVALPYHHFDAQSAAGALALPFGKAMVVTNVGSLTQLVRDKRAVCAPGSPEELAKKLTAILSNGSLRAKLEKDSLILSGQLSWEEVSRKTIRTYRSLIKNS